MRSITYKAASAVVVLSLIASGGCAALQPLLGGVVSRLSVDRVIACAKQPTPRDKARCLGAEAMTVGLGAALGEAARLGEIAIDKVGPNGADDLTDLEERKLARDLDRALGVLGNEIAATHGE